MSIILAHFAYKKVSSEFGGHSVIESITEVRTSKKNTTMNTEELKMARIGPMRADQHDLFAPVKVVDDDDKGKSKMSMLIERIALSLIQHLQTCHPSEYEVQNVLTYAVKTYSDNVRLEYMKFAETLEIKYSWEGLLTWWNHRDHGTDVTAALVYKERVAIHGYKGREKVMRIARLFKPTFGDMAATDKIIRERMTLPYRQKFGAYMARYGLPKCLRITKLWIWDIKGKSGFIVYFL